jgi:hypothetical protein
VGEFLILVGSFTHRITVDGEWLWLIRMPGLGAWGPRMLTALAALGVVLGAVYLLHLFQKLMFGPITQPQNAELADLSGREVAVFLPLIALVFVMGIYPQPFLGPMAPSVDRYIAEYKSRYVASKRHEGEGPVAVRELLGRDGKMALVRERGMGNGERANGTRNKEQRTENRERVGALRGELGLVRSGGMGKGEVGNGTGNQEAGAESGEQGWGERVVAAAAGAGGGG